MYICRDMKLEIERVKKIFGNVNRQNIAVIGDVMLDRYFWGSVSRVSPEAPVPVVDVSHESFHLGGAANVAQNLRSLGITPVLCGLLGNDEPADIFIEKCKQNAIIADGLYKDESRITTVKTRVIGNNQQIVRMDKEVRDKISMSAENNILDNILKINNLCGIIFEDYDKGTISSNLINNVISHASRNKIPVFVDPKLKNFNNYCNVSLFKPNRKETEEGLGCRLNSQDDILRAGKMLLERLNAENILITLGAEGMVLFEQNGSIASVDTMARKVADVSGAGDTAIATLAAMVVAGASYREAAIIANFASGIVCEKPGIVAIERNELIESIEQNSDCCQ